MINSVSGFMRNGQPESVLSLLKTSSLTAIQERSVALSTLNNLLNKLLPGNLAQQCKVVNYRQGVLILGVSSASWLTRLRYEQETLRTQLRQQGLSGLSSIQFKINPELNLNKSVLHSTENDLYDRKITPKSAQYLLALADNSPINLKNRLIKLANHATKIDNE